MRTFLLLIALVLLPVAGTPQIKSLSEVTPYREYWTFAGADQIYESHPRLPRLDRQMRRDVRQQARHTVHRSALDFALFARQNGHEAELMPISADEASVCRPHGQAKAVLKTNLLGWATTSPNLSAEFGVTPHFSLELTGAWNPWQFGREGTMRFWEARAEGRYWFCRRFMGHFLGLHAGMGAFNIGNVGLPFTHELEYHRVRGTVQGAGLTYGYYLPMRRGWAWEFSLGAGYAYVDYRKYSCRTCDVLQSHRSLHWFGPTRASIALVLEIR